MSEVYNLIFERTFLKFGVQKHGGQTKCSGVDLYTLAGNISSLVRLVGFYLLQIWRPGFDLEYCLIFGHTLILIIPLWGCISLADNLDFGFQVVIPPIT